MTQMYINDNILVNKYKLKKKRFNIGSVLEDRKDYGYFTAKKNIKVKSVSIKEDNELIAFRKLDIVINMLKGDSLETTWDLKITVSSQGRFKISI